MFGAKSDLGSESSHSSLKDIFILLDRVRGEESEGLMKFDIVINAESLEEDKGTLRFVVYRVEEGKRNVMLRSAIVVPLRPGRPSTLLFRRGFKVAMAVDVNQKVFKEFMEMFFKELVKEKITKLFMMIQGRKPSG